MPTLQEVESAFMRAHEAGDAEAAKVLAAEVQRLRSPGYEKGRALPGGTQGLLSALQGPTFGFSDEIIGAIGGGIRTLQNDKPFSENYAFERDTHRGAIDAQTEEFPIVSRVTRGMVAAPTAAVSIPGRAAATVLGQAGRAALAGLGFGVAQGAGESTAPDAAGVAKDAAISGATGAAVSGVASPVASVLGAAGKNVASRFNNSAAGNYARQKVAEAFARDQKAAGISDDAQTWLHRVRTRYNRLGPQARVADAGGQNTRQLLDTQATLPGKTKQGVETMIHDRQAGRAARLRSAAERELNPSGLRLQETIDDLVARRAESAAPLYAQLHRQTIPATDTLRAAVADAMKLGASRKAQTIATGRGTDLSLTKDAQSYAMRDLDHLKQGLDDLIGDQTDKITGRVSNVGAAIMAAKNRLVSELDTLTGGAYRAAREAFAGPSALIDAGNAGRRFLTLDDQGIQRAVRDMSEGEVEAFRLGAYEALRNKLGREGGQTEILKMWKEPATSERLKALFGSERAYRTFAAEVAREGRLKALEGVGRGSQTAARHYGAGDLDVSAVGDVAGAFTNAKVGNIPGMMTSAANAWNRVQTPEPVRDAIGNILLSGGQQGRANLNALQQIMQDVSDRRMAEALGLGLYGQQAGNALLSPFIPR